MATSAPARPPDARLLRALYGPLMDDARAEVMDTLAVAVMRIAGMNLTEIARELGIEVAGVNRHIKRLQAISDRIDIELPAPLQLSLTR